MGQAIEKYISEKEYLETERLATEKHEYFQGEIFPLYRSENSQGEIVAMSGASLSHNEIFSNIFGELSFKLKSKISFK